MRSITAILSVAAAALLSACDQLGTSQDDHFDPENGYACYQQHMFSLPDGAQYEGIDKVTGKAVRIKVMDGVNFRALECELKPDGTLK